MFIIDVPARRVILNNSFLFCSKRTKISLFFTVGFSHKGSFFFNVSIRQTLLRRTWAYSHRRPEIMSALASDIRKISVHISRNAECTADSDKNEKRLSQKDTDSLFWYYSWVQLKSKLSIVWSELIGVSIMDTTGTNFKEEMLYWGHVL